MWDRFDDAMDDLNDDIRDYKEEADELEAKLKKLGFKDFQRPNSFSGKEIKNDNYMNDAYSDKMGLWHEWGDYIEFLKMKLKELG